jgi:hypothetical protein
MGGTRKTGLTRPPRQGGPAGPGRLAQIGSGGRRPRFLPELLLFDFLLWSENFKGSLKKENEVLRVFLFGLFLFGRIGSSRINPSKQYFAPLQQPLCPQGA